MHPANMRRKKTFLFILLLILLGIFFFLKKTEPPLGPLNGVHEHVDFKVYLKGQAYNLSQQKYMSTADSKLSPFIHLHDSDGNIIHLHASGITLGMLFQSLGMNLTSTCFTLDNGTSYCTNQDYTLSMYVNGKKNNNYEKYGIKDLDRILLTYRNEDKGTLNTELNSVTDNACIFSGKCPERGAPPDESSCLTEKGACFA